MTTIEKLATEAGVSPNTIAESIRQILILDSEQKDGHKTMDQGTRDLFRRWLSDYTDDLWSSSGQTTERK